MVVGKKQRAQYVRMLRTARARQEAARDGMSKASLERGGALRGDQVLRQAATHTLGVQRVGYASYNRRQNGVQKRPHLYRYPLTYFSQAVPFTRCFTPSHTRSKAWRREKRKCAVSSWRTDARNCCDNNMSPHFIQGRRAKKMNPSKTLFRW